MKDAEFIELLNLYIDHEISAADSARLEAEVQGNPERRRTYQQYCRMQKGCKLLAEDFQTAPATERKIVAFETGARRPARTARFAALGTFAAAACLALIFINRDGGVPIQPPVVQNEVIAPAVVQAAATPEKSTGGIVHVVSVPPNQAVVAGRPLALSAQADAMLAAAAEQAGAQFEWMRSMQITPLETRMPLGNLRFEKPAVSPDGTRVYNGPQPVNEQVEFIGFRFNK